MQCGQISFFEEERDIMAYSISPWLTKLHFAFQDAISLYFVMDFHPGGDLLSLMSRFAFCFFNAPSMYSITYIASCDEFTFFVHRQLLLFEISVVFGVIWFLMFGMPMAVVGFWWRVME